jgi:hypothetical protein
MSYFVFSAGIDIRLDVRVIGILSLVRKKRYLYYPQRPTGYGFRAVSFPVDTMEFSPGIKLLCFATDQLLHNHPHLSSGAGTIGQKWPQYKGLSPTPLAIKESIYADTHCAFLLLKF